MSGEAWKTVNRAKVAIARAGEGYWVVEMKDHPGLMVGTPRGTPLPFDWMVGEFAGKIKDCQCVAKAKAAAPAGSQSKKRRGGEP